MILNKDQAQTAHDLFKQFAWKAYDISLWLTKDVYVTVDVVRNGILILDISAEFREEYYPDLNAFRDAYGLVE